MCIMTIRNILIAFPDMNIEYLICLITLLHLHIMMHHNPSTPSSSPNTCDDVCSSNSAWENQPSIFVQSSIFHHLSEIKGLETSQVIPDFCHEKSILQLFNHKHLPGRRGLNTKNAHLEDKMYLYLLRVLVNHFKCHLHLSGSFGKLQQNLPFRVDAGYYYINPAVFVVSKSKKKHSLIRLRIIKMLPEN